MTWRDGWEEETGTRWRPWKAFWVLIGIIALVGVAGGVLGWFGSWGNKAAEVVGPQNVEEQYTDVINGWESLYAAAENACLAGSKSPDESSPVLVESPEQAYAATFRKIVTDYNRRMANLFEAGIVAPSGYPDEIPRSLGADGEWCSVPVELDTLQSE